MKSLVAAIALSCVALTGAQAAIVNFGTLGQSVQDCTFTCTTRLQQDYAASFFGSQSVNISEVSFYTGGGFINGSSVYSMYLSTNPHGSTLVPTFSQNVSSDRVLFATLTTTAFAAGNVNFFGSFAYDPTKGNLIVDIVNSNPGFSSAFSSTNNVNRVYQFDASSSGEVDNGYGLATSFVTGASNAVPEPGTVALLGLGLLGVIASRRKSSKNTNAQAA